MRFQLVRHATLRLDYAGKRLLVDPVLADPESLDPAPNAANRLRNPRVPLPFEASRLLDTDAILVTHAHRDHFDDAAAAFLPKHLPLFCQPEDADLFERRGFHYVTPVSDIVTWGHICIVRTGGRHGTGETGERMGKVSGYVLYTVGDATLYIAGDTVWCPEVEEALTKYVPDVCIVNAGAAQFLEGGPITMDADDVVRLARAIPWAQIVAVHMEAWNHCLLTRADLGARFDREKLSIRIPLDGEEFRL